MGCVTVAGKTAGMDPDFALMIDGSAGARRVRRRRSGPFALICSMEGGPSRAVSRSAARGSFHSSLKTMHGSPDASLRRGWWRFIWASLVTPPSVTGTFLASSPASSLGPWLFGRETQRTNEWGQVIRRPQLAVPKHGEQEDATG